MAGPDDFSELAYVVGFSCDVHGGDVCEDDSVDDADDDGDAYEGCGVNDEYNVWLGCGNDGDDGGDDDGDNEVCFVCHGGEDDGADNVCDDDDDGNDDGDDEKSFGEALSLDLRH